MALHREGKMKNALVTLLVIAACFIAIPRSADAHHGYAAFDTKAVVTLKGTVTDFHFVNPHSVVEFEVKNDKGEIQDWKGELTSPGHLAPNGWTATTLKPGDEIVITGWKAKNGSPSIWVTKIVLANGREMKLGSDT